MLNLAYIKLVWRNNRIFALFSMLFIMLFQFLLLYLVTTFDTEAMFSVILAQLPPTVKAFMQDSFFSMLTYDGAAAFGFNHPIVLSILVILAISIPTQHISREIENGTLELLLAHPFKRSTLILSLWTAGGLIIMLIMASALAGSILAILIFHHLTTLNLIHLLQIAANLWLLIYLILSFTLMIAVFSRPGFKAGNLSAVITLVFYLLYFIAQIWDDISFTKPINIFHYFQPQNVMMGKGNIGRDLMVLAGAVLICFGISYRQFERRDIP